MDCMSAVLVGWNALNEVQSQKRSSWSSSLKKKKKKELHQASSYPSISGPEIIPPLLQDAWYSIVIILAGTNNVMRYVQDYGKIT